MEGYHQKAPNELHPFGFGSSNQHFGGVPTTSQNILDNLNPSQSYPIQTHTTTSQVDNSGSGIIPTPGTSLQEDFVGEVVVPQSTGRRKKKKHKSGESNPGSSVKPEVMDEEDANTLIPLLADNQGIEDQLFIGNLPPSDGVALGTSDDSVGGGQNLLNNSLLDQILTEKKLQLMHSPEVMEWLQNHMKK